MKILHKSKLGLPLFGMLAGALALAPNLHAQPVGQWDFDNGDLTATVGTDLQYADGPGGVTQSGTAFGTTTSFGIPDINGTAAKVMRFPVATNGMGYNMLTPSNPNAGGSKVNDYTLILDVLYPQVSDSKLRPIIDVDGSTFVPGPDIVVDKSNGIGITPNGPYLGTINSNTWYRIGFVVQQDLSTVTLYVNGQRVGSDPVPSGIQSGLDGRFGLVPLSYALILGTTDTNAAMGYVNSIQIRDVALNAGQMQALGGPSATGIPQTIPPVPSFIDSRSPDINSVNQLPEPNIDVVLNQGDTLVNSNSIQLYLDGKLLPATVTPTAPTFTIQYAETNLLRPLSKHQLSLVYSDSVAGNQTNSWDFTVCNYQNVTLPAPIYFENFDEVSEGGIPAGWTVTNWSDSVDAGLNLSDVQSDSYLNWVTISVTDYTNYYPWTADYTSPGFPEVSGNRRIMIPPIVENGVLLDSLASGNLMVAESDQRNGSQVQVMFTSDYDLTGKTNVFLSFHNMNEQNQDNISAVEYSIDHGVTWQPLLYMLDDGTTDGNGSDVVTNSSTGQIDVNATFNTARTDQAHNLAYGAYIGAAITTNLIPYIRPCRNDDPVQQKRIEVLRMPLADNQPAVRLRFMYAGTGSWFFDIDDVGFYSINTPVITQQPLSQTVDAGTPVTFTVAATGHGPITYQWEANGNTVPGATTTSYTIPSVAPSDAGLYDVVVSNSDGPVVSGTAQLTVITTPQILTQPYPELVFSNAPATFTATARGGRPLSYQWYKGSTPVAGATTTMLTLPAVQPSDAGSYSMVVSNVYGTNVSASAQLTVFSGPITSGLLVHLKFDNDYTDSSGNGANASAAGSPVFTPGIIGQAVHVTSTGTPANAPATNNYVSIASGVSVGTGDFSVSLWAKVASHNDDKPFVSNKDWGSGGNPGWVLATESGGTKWNMDDGSSGRHDSSTVAPQLEDGTWHNLVVTFMRSTIAEIYVDGQLVHVDSDAPNAGTTVSSLDTSFPINIGQDGTGQYTDGGGEAAVDMLVDDFGMWGRALTPSEVMSIYSQGQKGQDLTTATGLVAAAPPMLSIAPQGGNSITFTWTGSANLRLQKNLTLNPATWTDVPGTLGASAYSEPRTNAAAFYRLYMP